MNHDWKATLVPHDGTIRDALQTIEEAGKQIALVVDAEGNLLGTVTDGDIRRGLLRGLSVDAPVTEVLYTTPTLARPSERPHELLELMRKNRLHHLPVVDARGRLVGLHLLEELFLEVEPENWVVLMAGGLGSRLAPLTDDCPKPLLKVGGRPVLETIIETFLKQGFKRFYVSVNYRADMIVEHFGDGSRMGADIRYLHEAHQMGTAGALTLLPEMPTQPLIVMNGDLLTKLDFNHLLDFHAETGAVATMCVRDHSYQVPYGVVRTDGYRLLGIDEKPISNFAVSAGVYVLSPAEVGELPKNTAVQMPDVFERLVQTGKSVQTYPVRDYWIDIGRMSDLERANGEYRQIFG